MSLEWAPERMAVGRRRREDSPGTYTKYSSSSCAIHKTHKGYRSPCTVTVTSESMHSPSCFFFFFFFFHFFFFLSLLPTFYFFLFFFFPPLIDHSSMLMPSWIENPRLSEEEKKKSTV